MDYAKESSNFNKLKITAKSGSYAQSQVNDIDKESVISLLK